MTLAALGLVLARTAATVVVFACACIAIQTLEKETRRRVNLLEFLLFVVFPIAMLWVH